MSTSRYPTPLLDCIGRVSAEFGMRHALAPDQMRLHFSLWHLYTFVEEVTASFSGMNFPAKMAETILANGVIYLGVPVVFDLHAVTARDRVTCEATLKLELPLLLTPALDLPSIPETPLNT